MKREYKKISESRLAERPLIVLEAEIRKWGEVWYVEFQMLVGHVEISPSLDSAAQGKDIEKQKQSKKKKKIESHEYVERHFKTLQQSIF